MVAALPTILSYGMGVESSAILVRWVLSPESRPCPAGRAALVANPTNP